MKIKLFLLVLIFWICIPNIYLNAQNITVYKTFIYTSESLADEIQKINEEQDDTRRFDTDLLNATLGAVKGIGSGYVSAFIDLGVSQKSNITYYIPQIPKSRLGPTHSHVTLRAVLTIEEGPNSTGSHPA